MYFLTFFSICIFCIVLKNIQNIFFHVKKAWGYVRWKIDYKEMYEIIKNNKLYTLSFLSFNFAVCSIHHYDVPYNFKKGFLIFLLLSFIEFLSILKVKK